MSGDRRLRQRQEPSSPASSAGRSPIPARRACTASGCEPMASTAPTCRCRYGRNSSRRRHPRLAAAGIRRRQRDGAAQGGGVAAVDRVTPQARRIGAVNTIVVAPRRHASRAATPTASGFSRTCDSGRAGMAPGRARPCCSAPAARRGRLPWRCWMRGVPEIRLVNRTAERRRTLARRYRRPGPRLCLGRARRGARAMRRCW